MSTKPRGISESGFYHIYQRGVSKFDIFEDDADRRFFLKRLRRYAEKYKAEIHVWCLMSNHIHLLVRGAMPAVSGMMRTLLSAYTRMFNKRHGRSGPLYDGRFCSVPIDTDEYFLSVLRYIHRNPSVHDRAVLSGDYPWSSYREFLGAGPRICKQYMVWKLLKCKDEYIELHKKELDGYRHLDEGSIGRMDDEEARARANWVLERAGFKVSVVEVGALERASRDRAIAVVRATIGASLRQLQRLTSLAYSVILSASKDTHKFEPLSADETTCFSGGRVSPQSRASMLPALP